MSGLLAFVLCCIGAVALYGLCLYFEAREQRRIKRRHMERRIWPGE